MGNDFGDIYVDVERVIQKDLMILYKYIEVNNQ